MNKIEKRTYNFSFNVEENNLKKIQDFLLSLSKSKNTELEYHVEFDNQNKHQIVTTSIDDIITESYSRKSTIKSITIFFNYRASNPIHDIKISIYLGYYHRDISFEVQCLEPFKISHQLEGIINECRNNNMNYCAFILIISSIVLSFFLVLITFESNRLPEFLLYIDPIQRFLNMFVITMSLVTALCLCYVKPAILMLFPNKLFVLGEGKRKYNNIKKIRAIITSIVISVVVGLFFI